MLAVFAVNLGSIVRQKITLADRLNNRRQLFLIAEAGALRAFAELRKKDSTLNADALNDSWSSDEGMFKEVPLEQGAYSVEYQYKEDGGEKTRYGLLDEERKVNLNKADVEVMARLLQMTAGLGSEKSTELAFAIFDWRDADSFFQHPEYGAEDDDYREMRLPFESKDGAFERTEELLLVKGMTREIFDKIKNFITIYPESNININTASKETLLAYGLQENLADLILSFRKGQDSQEGTTDDQVFYQSADVVPKLSQAFNLGINDIDALSSFISKANPATTSDNFMVRSLGRLDKNKQELEIVAVINRKSQVRYWREEYRKSSHDGAEAEF